MTELRVGFLENFAIRNWYRFVAYLGGITLVLSFFLEPKWITIEKLRGFSVWSIFIGLFLWILSEIFVYFGSRKECVFDNERKFFEVSLGIAWFAINIFSFSLWMYCVFVTCC
ncbi:MAG: hypothetical protein J7K38_04825 [Thermoplasmata archaeon]|nr:hypothetical protein [Thermoplasmata archaeon]